MCGLRAVKRQQEKALEAPKAVSSLCLEAAMGPLSLTSDQVQVQGQVPFAAGIGSHPLRLTHGCRRSPWDLIIHTNQSAGCRPWPCKERQRAGTDPACPRWPCPEAAGRPAPEPAAPYIERMSVPREWQACGPAVTVSPAQKGCSVPTSFSVPSSRAAARPPGLSVYVLMTQEMDAQAQRVSGGHLEDRKVRNLPQEAGSVLRADAEGGRGGKCPFRVFPTPSLPAVRDSGGSHRPQARASQCNRSLGFHDEFSALFSKSVKW